MKEPIAPFLSLETTLDCNLNCVMCSNPRESKRTPQITPGQIKEILRYTGSLVPDVVFTGGEPLIDPLLPEYLECLPKSTRVTILTNGTTLGDRFFKEQILPRVYELRVSIDDMVDQTSSVQRIGSNPKEIFDNLITVHKEFPSLVIVITTVVNAPLLFRIDEFYDRVTTESAGISALRFIPQIYYKGRASQAISERKWEVDFERMGKSVPLLIQKYLRRERDFDLDIQYLFCSVTLGPDYVIETFDSQESPCQYQDVLFVNNQGDLLFCPNAPTRIACIGEFEKVEDFIMQRFKSEVVDNHPYRKLKGKDKFQCLSCRYRRLCGFGCPAVSEAICGDARLPDPIKCSYSRIWEREILPILPGYLQEKFRSVLNHEGTFPQEFRNIVEILEKYQGNS